MKSKNICKFINDTDTERLRVHRFVLERDPSVMSNGIRLDSNTVYLVTEGNCTFCVDGKSVSSGKGTLVFAFDGETVLAEKFTGGTEYMYLSFDGGRADELFRRFAITPARRAFEGFEGMIPFWQESISRASDDCIDLVSESVLMYTFSRLKVAKKQSDDVVSKAIQIVEDDFTSPELSLATVADRLGYNVKYLSHSFKEKMGMGFSQYLRTVRIKHAVFLMEHGVNSVKNVAFLCGFTDPLYFSSVFKEALGVSPKDFMSNK